MPGRIDLVRDNPLVIVMFSMIIISGLVMVSMPSWLEISETHNESIYGDQIGYGYGTGLSRGSELTIEYDIDGGTTDVELSWRPQQYGFMTSGEVIETRDNSRSGTITHNVDKDGYYGIMFEGRNVDIEFTYTYTSGYNSAQGALSVLIGSFFILVAIIGLNRYYKMENPSYMDKRYKMLSLFLFFFSPVGLLVGLVTSDSILVFQASMLLISGYMMWHFWGATGKCWFIRSKLFPLEAEVVIESYMGQRGIKYNAEANVKEGVLKWDKLYRLDNGGKIGLKMNHYTTWNSLVFIGPGEKDSALREVAYELTQNMEQREGTFSKY